LGKPLRPTTEILSGSYVRMNTVKSEAFIPEYGRPIGSGGAQLLRGLAGVCVDRSLVSPR